MKIPSKLIAILLLASGTVCSETIAEAEKSFLKEADNYQNHPLYMYLKPEGAKALDYAFSGFPASCFNDSIIESEKCEKKRITLVTNLTTKYNFSDVSVSDFKNKDLWLLYQNLRKLQQAKLKELTDKMNSLKLKDRLPLMESVKTLNKQEKVLTEHFKNSRKYSNANDKNSLLQLEASVNRHALKFKNHPLHHYMQLAGYKALGRVLYLVQQHCQSGDLVDTKECEYQRQGLVNTLENDYGFSNVSTDDFKDSDLWIIEKELHQLYIEKNRVYNKMAMQVQGSARWEAKQPIRDLEAQTKVFVDHLVNSRKTH